MNILKHFIQDIVKDDLKTFAQVIHNIRVCEEWTQVEMAKKLGCSAAFLCMVESGKRLVCISTAEKWADILGYSPEVFKKYAINDWVARMLKKQEEK